MRLADDSGLGDFARKLPHCNSLPFLSAFRVNTSLVREVHLEGERFEFCAEVTAKVCRLGIAVVEVPISYQPRSAGEGKKIGWRDLWPTLWTLLKWCFARFRKAPLHG